MKLGFFPKLLLLALCSACAGTGPSPAAPPAPLSEVPSLRFPEEIGGQFDLTTVANSGTGAALKAFVTEGDDISGTIADSAQNAAITSSLIDEILGPLHDLVIPRREDVTNFEDIIVIGNQLVHVKLDFAHFDNRLAVSCSGHTAEVPICYRMWFNGKRALSGVFLNIIPTEFNSGDGYIQGLSPVTLIGAPFATTVFYDLRDPNLLKAEYFLGAKEINSPPLEDIPEHESEFLTAIHLTLEQDGPPISALKLINAIIRRYFEGKVEDEQRDVGRWQEGEDLWSGTHDIDPLDDYSGFGEFFAACARISSGLVINSSFCEASGIDVSEVDPLGFLKIGDLTFPNNFPLSPTF